ncbi:MAG: hypothetical protein M3Q45_02730, partial [Chloroflexota bacterium]|nr:hypothetical protein [Chloroflexota bacterium]
MEQNKDSEKQSWLRRQLQRRRANQAGDTIAAQVGADARNVVVGKNVIQIGTLKVSLPLAVLIAAGLSVIAVSTALLAFGNPFAKPARMTGQYNIAIAQFGEISGNGRLQATANGLALSRWVYDALK